MVRNITLNLVKQAIYCYEQCTPQKYEEDIWKANDFESRIYELFKLMTNDELDLYRAQLVELGYVHPDEYKYAERYVTAQV